MDKCYYEILETDITATQEEIQKSFRKLVKKWHPDICKHPSAEIKIKEINEAYDILKDSEKRKSYNIQKGYALNKKTAKDDFNYKYDYNSKNFNKETNKTKDFQNEKSNEFKRENYDLIYNVIKKYVTDTQIKPDSLKFPSINFINFTDKSSFFLVEGYFQSENWVEKTIKTTYSAKITLQFKLLSMDFLMTEEISQQAKQKKHNNKRNFETKKKRPFFLSLQFIIIFIVTLFVFLLSYNKPNTEIQRDTGDNPSKVSNTEDNDNPQKENSFSDSEQKNINKNFIIFEEAYFIDTLNTLIEKKDVDNPITRNFALKIASEIPGSYNIGQIARIYDYLYKNWKYVSDPTGKEYFSKASETIENNFSGDCDDFAILLSSCIEAIGGNTRITFAQNSTGGHAYTEVRISQNEEESKELIKSLGNYINTMYGQTLRSTYNYRKDTNGTIWLNLDWGSPSPGNEYFLADKEVVFDTLSNKYFITKGFNK